MKRMLVLLLVPTMLLFACGGSDESEPAASDTPETVTTNSIEVTMQDYAFAVEGEPTAGPLTVNFSNAGEELHHGIIGRLDEGKTIEDVQNLLAEGANGPPPPWFDDTPIDMTVVSPGQNAGVVIDAEEGTYALICFMPGPQNKPHALHGMVQGFEVGAGDAAASPPEADASLSMTEEGIEAPEISAGVSYVEVTNDAEVEGEVFVIQLAEGKTLDDIEPWFEKGQQGLAPATFLGGTHSFASGESVTLSLFLEPGDYQIVASYEGKDGEIQDLPTDFTVD